MDKKTLKKVIAVLLILVTAIIGYAAICGGNTLFIWISLGLMVAASAVLYIVG